MKIRGLTDMPSRLIVFSFVSLIVFGSLLLLLPVSTTRGISLVDAVFTATSAVCVTGLIVKDTPVDFTVFGQAVILLLIQVGGLGYMTMGSLAALALGKRVSYGQRLLIKESLNLSSMEGIVRFIKVMIIFVFLAESLGAAVLTMNFMKSLQFREALMQGVFHSVSAFNNAGFSLFSDNLIKYRGDAGVNLSIMCLIVTGGIGFMTLTDVARYFTPYRKKLMLHTLIVTTFTAGLILTGALLIFIVEKNHVFYELHMSSGEMIMTSFFSSVTARTAGFNTIDYSKFQPVTLFLIVTLMIIGASPGSTGGGVKTSTIAVVLAHIWQLLRGKRDTVIFRRRISEEIVSKSLIILSLAIMYIVATTIVIMDMEGYTLIASLFEVASAFGTVGLSVGDGGILSLSALFSTSSKTIIIFTMLLGRVGPLTLFTAIAFQRKERFRYPEGRVMIG